MSAIKKGTRFHETFFLTSVKGQNIFPPPYLKRAALWKIPCNMKSPMINKYLIHLMYVLRTGIPLPQGAACYCQFASHGKPEMASPVALPMLVWKEASWRWKKLFKVGDSSEAITLGQEWLLIKNSFSLEETLVRSWPALSGILLVFAGLEGASVGLKWWEELKNPIEAKSPESTP